MTAAEVMRSYVAAMRRGDRDAALGHLTDDVVLHVPGRSRLAGVRRGRDAFAAYVRAAVEHAHGDIELELIDMLAGEERVALLVAERLGGPEGLHFRRANVYRVKDGRVAEIWIFESDQYAVDEFLADQPAPA